MLFNEKLRSVLSVFAILCGTILSVCSQPVYGSSSMSVSSSVYNSVYFSVYESTYKTVNNSVYNLNKQDSILLAEVNYTHNSVKDTNSLYGSLEVINKFENNKAIIKVNNFIYSDLRDPTSKANGTISVSLEVDSFELHSTSTINSIITKISRDTYLIDFKDSFIKLDYAIKLKDVSKVISISTSDSKYNIGTITGLFKGVYKSSLVLTPNQ